jgi:hypothetical protein
MTHPDPLRLEGIARHRVSCRLVSSETPLPYWLLRHLHAAVTFESLVRAAVDYL